MTLRFADCTLDIAGHDLWRDGERVAIEPQVFDVLAYLVDHRDRVVPKTELLDEVWGDRFVSESALTSRIKSARRAVGDTGRDQRVIRTVHGRGFRFVAEVRASEAASPGVPSSVAPESTGVVASLVAEALTSGVGLAVELVGPAMELSRTVDDLYEAAAARGYLVGRGSGAGAGLRPYGCVLDAVDELVQRAPELLAGLPQGCRDELETVLDGRQPSNRARLFLGVRELLVGAAALRPTLLVVDELQFADPDTLALLDHAARLTSRRPLVVVGAHRPGSSLGESYRRAELVGTGEDSELGGEARSALPAELTEVLRTVALEGSSFDLVLFRAAVGSEDPAAHRLLDVALASGAVESVPTGGGYRFASPGLAEDLVADLAPHRRAALHAELAGRLVEAGADPSRIAHHLLAAHEPKQALPYAVIATRQADVARRYPEVLRWTAAVLDHATGDERRELLTRRASALVGTGDPTAVQVYREALALAAPGEATELRAGLARAAVLSGDIETAREALAGVAEDDNHRPPVLVVRALVAYFEGELDVADALLDEARSASPSSGPTVGLLDAISLQGLIAHNRGEWFDRLRRELRSTRDSPELAVSIFDSHLCVAEYLLYGPTPYQEVVELSASLRGVAEQSGARRAVAFAACVAGEAKLLAGELDDARHDLEEAVRLHRELGADTGTAHSLQRLAELELVCGEPVVATSRLREAAVLARWSPLSQHLLQRIYGTLIAAAPDGSAALAVVDEAADVLDAPGTCEICQVMVEVPAAIACAEGGRIEEAQRHLGRASWSAGFWEGTAWRAAVAEAEAAVARAQGRAEDARERLAVAATLFDQAGQPLDAARCREGLDDMDLSA